MLSFSVLTGNCKFSILACYLFSYYFLLIFISIFFFFFNIKFFKYISEFSFYINNYHIGYILISVYATFTGLPPFFFFFSKISLLVFIVLFHSKLIAVIITLLLLFGWYLYLNILRSLNIYAVSFNPQWDYRSHSNITSYAILIITLFAFLFIYLFFFFHDINIFCYWRGIDAVLWWKSYFYY